MSTTIHAGDVSFELLGEGMCRGEGWQRGRWPIGRGERSLQECANACAAKAGCTAFDLSHQGLNSMENWLQIWY